jgi:hypothetical protein
MSRPDEPRDPISISNSPIVGTNIVIGNQGTSVVNVRMDVAALAADLTRLHAALRTATTGTAAEDAEMEAVRQAEVAAAAGDTRGALAALKTAGTWTLRIAGAIGAEAAAAALMSAAGLR